MILIVDDFADNGRALQKLLEYHGYYVECATSGETALSVVRAVKPCLIIMDANMPGETGIEVMRVIRLNPEMKEVPVLFYSASNDQRLVNLAKTAGAAEWVVKGFHSWEYLLGKIQQHYQANASQPVN